MTSPDYNPELAVSQLFYPELHQERARVRSLGGRFVYYTSAETAANILSSRELWMRSTMVMNDFSEVEYGMGLLMPVLRSGPAGVALKGALDLCFPDFAAKVRDHFEAWLPGFKHDTFITCVSAHHATEDQNGRLSMWRAYGGKAGVALVLNGGVMDIRSQRLKVTASPVIYTDGEGMSQRIYALAARISANVPLLQSLGEGGLHGHIFRTLRFAILCTKHPGFAEEQEWRIVSSPAVDGMSEQVPSSVRTVNGVPQAVLRIQLQNHLESGLTGLAVPELIERIIIGPSDDPEVIRRALVQLYAECGKQNPMNHIQFSGIPLRHRS